LSWSTFTLHMQYFLLCIWCNSLVLFLLSPASHYLFFLFFTLEAKSNDHSDWSRDDNDLGGCSSVFLIDNLDKDLSPSTIVEFIHSRTSLSVQACVFPSMSSEMYTQGAIVLNCRKNLEKLSKFLDCQDHIIMSKRGRYVLW